MVFTFPYKLAVRFSYARTLFEVHTPENVYHTDANIRMQQRLNCGSHITNLAVRLLRRNSAVSPHPRKYLPFEHQQRNAMEIQTSAHTQPTSSFQWAGGQECRIGVQHGRQPPAQLDGISVTTWGARQHGNIAVADDSCAGPPPLLTNPLSA